MPPTREVTLKEYTCDGCGNVRYGNEHGELPQGYHGQVTHIYAGGEFAEWYACRDRCVGPAVRNALARPDYPVDEP